MKAYQARAGAQVQNPCAQNPARPERRRLYCDDTRRDRALGWRDGGITAAAFAPTGGNSASSVPCHTGKTREKFFFVASLYQRLQLNHRLAHAIR